MAIINVSNMKYGNGNQYGINVIIKCDRRNENVNNVAGENIVEKYQ